jgi:hypothetical protein
MLLKRRRARAICGRVSSFPRFGSLVGKQPSQLNDVATIRHYFIGEKSVGCMYVTSTFSTSLSVCSDFTIS